MSRMLLCIISIFLLVVPLSCRGQQIPYYTVPDWVSNPLEIHSYPNWIMSTGLAIADINGDSWKDIIASNGNDMAQQHVIVYYNNGDGTFPTQPSWASKDTALHTKLAVGDINKDGWLDVSVSVILGPDTCYAGGVKVYFNKGGELESLPSFRSADQYQTFDNELGDADGDGDLDLAVAVGNPSAPHKTKRGCYWIGQDLHMKGLSRIYYNNGGTLDTLPGWVSADSMLTMGASFADINHDGFLDLALADSCARVFLSDEGKIPTTSSWHSTTSSFYPNSIDLGRQDVTSLVISYTHQYQDQETGLFCLYRLENPIPSSSDTIWTASEPKWSSAVRLADINGDGNLDLLAGAFGMQLIYNDVPGILPAPLVIYLGTGTKFQDEPAYISNTTTVLEDIAVADLNKDGIIHEKVVIKISQTSQHVIQLPHQVIEEIIAIKKNGSLLPYEEYTSVPCQNWISFVEPLKSDDVVVVEYSYSNRLDIIVTNWGLGKGNYIFYNNQKE